MGWAQSPIRQTLDEGCTHVGSSSLVNSYEGVRGEEVKVDLQSHPPFQNRVNMFQYLINSVIRVSTMIPSEFSLTDLGSQPSKLDRTSELSPIFWLTPSVIFTG